MELLNEMTDLKPLSSCGTTLIFPCAGATNLGQLSMRIGYEMEKKGIGTLKCTTGIGGQLADFLIAVNLCDQIIAIDGCDLKCTKRAFQKAGFTVNKHIVLSELGLKLNRDLNVPDFLVNETMKKIEGMSTAETMPQ
jgi:uncharacterized metal-binding protein